MTLTNKIALRILLFTLVLFGLILAGADHNDYSIAFVAKSFASALFAGIAVVGGLAYVQQYYAKSKEDRFGKL